MSDAIEPPRRKRLSWECRCEIVAKVRVGGISAEVAAATSGVHRSTVYRLLARHQAEGWAGLRERRPASTNALAIAALVTVMNVTPIIIVRTASSLPATDVGSRSP
jgi:transposase